MSSITRSRLLVFKYNLTSSLSASESPFQYLIPFTFLRNSISQKSQKTFLFTSDLCSCWGECQKFLCWDDQLLISPVLAGSAEGWMRGSWWVFHCSLLIYLQCRVWRVRDSGAGGRWGWSLNTDCWSSVPPAWRMVGSDPLPINIIFFEGKCQVMRLPLKQTKLL